MTLCPHCFSPLPKEYVRAKTWSHTFNATLAGALQKFARGVSRKGRNEIHLRHDLTGDLNLTRDELNNFTKVRFFALVAKVRNPDGSHKKGYWLLTRRGSQFLKGLTAIPRKVITLDNQVVGHSDEMITIRDLSGLPPIDLSFDIIGGDVYTTAPRQGSLLPLLPLATHP